MSKKKANKRVVHNIEEARNNVVSYKRNQTVDIIPRNTAQEYYVDELHDYNNRIIFAIGPAGTGKTMLAVLRAIKALRNKEVSRIVVTRPSVAVAGENHGFLPGDLTKKMEPWCLPVLDIFNEYWSPREIQQMIDDKILEFSPLMYMRGRTFKDTYIIFDEAQNSTKEQMKMLLTRIGEGTTLLVTGDPEQSDLSDNNGLADVTTRMDGMAPQGMPICLFDQTHVERDPIVRTVLKLY